MHFGARRAMICRLSSVVFGYADGAASVNVDDQYFVYCCLSSWRSTRPVGFFENYILVFVNHDFGAADDWNLLACH